MYSFYAMLGRMKYINRWSLMRNSRTENISEHSQEVALLCHALALIGNRRLGRHYNPERAALLGLFHDATEILTGDMPTPVKYNDEHIRAAYRHLEDQAAQQLLSKLPEDLREDFRPLLCPEEAEEPLWKLVKAADKLSALIKCLEEAKAGNREFMKAETATRDKLKEISLPEAEIFMKEFLEPYSRSLDEM